MSRDVVESGSFVTDDVARKPTDQFRIVSWNVAHGARVISAKDVEPPHLLQGCAFQTKTFRGATHTGNLAGASNPPGIDFFPIEQAIARLKLVHRVATLYVIPRARYMFW